MMHVTQDVSGCTDPILDHQTDLQDAGLNLSQERKEPFLELHRILEALKNKDLGPALQWVVQNHSATRRRCVLLLVVNSVSLRMRSDHPTYFIVPFGIFLCWNSQGSPFVRWEGRVCNHFPTTVAVHTVIHTSAVLPTTPAGTLWLWSLICHEDCYNKWNYPWPETLNTTNILLLIWCSSCRHWDASNGNVSSF